VKLLVVGGSLVDIVARATGPVVADASNEAEIRWGAGGAGRNVAENLARLGAQVTLATDLADDLPGRFLRENMAACGIDVRVAAHVRTGLYLAILDADGTLGKGYCQTGTELVRLDEYLAVLPDLASFDGVALDTNLSEEALAGLAQRCREVRVPFALQTVASERARRALSAIPGCVLVKPNAPRPARSRASRVRHRPMRRAVRRRCDRSERARSR